MFFSNIYYIVGLLGQIFRVVLAPPFHPVGFALGDEDEELEIQTVVRLSLRDVWA